MVGSGFRLFKVFGITVRVDWSWLLILVLITWNLSAVFGQLHPQWSPALQWGIGLTAALVFFASVLAHEMAHSLVAKSKGIPVRNITLFLFGGVSNIRNEPDSPQTEFLMAIVGPLTSIVIGVVLVLLVTLFAVPTGEPGQGNVIAQMGPLGTLTLWLGSVNILLGVFNLIPGFPLDGGRVLRSILWGITDNLRRATRWATWVGHLIAWTMILAGVAMAFGVTIPFFGTGLLSGLWLAFIGWFLNTAASQSYQRVVINDILEGVPVRRMMRADPPTVPADISVGELVHNYVMRTDDYAFPVVDGENLAGIVTMEDVRKTPREEWDTVLVRNIMTPGSELVTVTPNEDAADALDKLMDRDVRQLPVLQDGHLAGLVRRQDIMRYLRLQSEAV